MRLKILSALIIFSLVPSMALAQDSTQDTAPAETTEAQTEGFVYSPEHCEFSVTFPDEPEKVQRCQTTGDKQCYELVSYTKVFELATTVNFRVICNPSDDEIYGLYNQEVMKTTLKAMTNRNVIKTYETSFREEENYKQAALIGEGHMGVSSTLYIAQLWISPFSSLSVEAELVGDSMAASEELFSELLRSVHFKAPEEAKTPKETKK